MNNPVMGVSPLLGEVKKTSLGSVEASPELAKPLDSIWTRANNTLHDARAAQPAPDRKGVLDMGIEGVFARENSSHPPLGITRISLAQGGFGDKGDRGACIRCGGGSKAAGGPTPQNEDVEAVLGDAAQVEGDQVPLHGEVGGEIQGYKQFRGGILAAQKRDPSQRANIGPKPEHRPNLGCGRNLR